MLHWRWQEQSGLKFWVTPGQHLAYRLPDLDTWGHARTDPSHPPSPSRALHPGTPCPGHRFPSTALPLMTAGCGTDNGPREMPSAAYLINSPYIALAAIIAAGRSRSSTISAPLLSFLRQQI